jgi:cytochrome c biogenesis protein CcdA
VNAASSLVAVLIFAGRGVIDWRLGVLLSFTMFLGGAVGAQVTLRLSDLWLRRLFVTVVILLALQVLVLNVPWERLISVFRFFLIGLQKEPVGHKEGFSQRFALFVPRHTARRSAVKSESLKPHC